MYIIIPPPRPPVVSLYSFELSCIAPLAGRRISSYLSPAAPSECPEKWGSIFFVSF